MAKKPSKKRQPRKPLVLKPHDLTPDAWFYDQSGGIEITIWTTSRVNKGERQADQLSISWRTLRAALSRNGKI